ncbi:glycoside hydrolase superfamily [Cadophora sp. MPI-SDFR-AT-0126]|nr:glycoside hydrolase superfamily [Leotiomycetes sp. MPI-SDFR-AT-0126]
MRFNIESSFILLSGGVLAASLEIRQTTSCTTPNGAGYCDNTANGCTRGTFYAGFCPGASNIQCCVVPCSTPSGSGHCQYTTSTCSGSFISGYCPGASNYQCCVGSSSASGLPGIDLSGTPSASFWTCAASNYKVVALRGYQQACGSGGQVASNFVANYRAAKSAGVARIDAYMFPCTGTQPTGVACKSPATQLSEFLNAIDSNGMTLGTLWFDIEPTSGTCNAWNLGATQNTALARQWVSLLQGSGRKWGIYANGNQWSGMFGSRSTDVGSQLPLWAVQFDRTPGVNTVNTFMGGWTSAVAKQYVLDTTACGFSVDLDSFLP